MKITGVQALTRRAARLGLVATALSLVVAAADADMGRNMIGQASHNVGITVVPAPGAVKIDGALSDWDWSGRIQSFADYELRDRFSTETAAMWDQEALYVAVKWRDATPMMSPVDPVVEPGNGWKADALQLRVATADQTSWVTTWFFAGRGEPALSLSKWKERNNAGAGMETRHYVGKGGAATLGDGIDLAYRKDADGKGYAQELRIPWSQLYRRPPPAAPGQSLRIGLEFLWGAMGHEAAGYLREQSTLGWPIHRYADNMQPGQTTQWHFWEAKDSWGNATLAATGNLTPRAYRPAVEQIPGSIPIRATIPAAARRFTVVIDRADGARVRNLVADVEPAVYSQSEDGATRTIEVMWDGLDDMGRPVPPGDYQARGLSAGAISAAYEMSFYNPGTPPWPTADGTGGWGADHVPPKGVVTAGDRVIVHWPFAEVGFGLIAIGPEGRKVWSQYRGADHVAADGQSVYAFETYAQGRSTTGDCLTRYALKDGTPKPFTLDGKDRAPLNNLSLREVLGESLYTEAKQASEAADLFGLWREDGLYEHPRQTVVTGMAVKDGLLVLALANDRLALLEAESAQLRGTIPAQKPSSPVFDWQGNLYALLDGQAHRIDLKTGATEAWPTPEVGKASAITFDRQGNLLVADVGPDSQVKAFNPSMNSGQAGKLLYTCGRKGGRPIRGDFDRQAMTRMSGLAVDAAGHVWVTERWEFPRRVSVWAPSSGPGKDGPLVRDYIGNTGYVGGGAYLHDQDPNLAYMGPIEMRLDRVTQSWNVTRILWVPDRAKGEKFIIHPGTARNPHRFRRAVDGVEREYCFKRSGREQVLFMEFADGWRPVNAITAVGYLLDLVDDSHGGKVLKLPEGDWQGLDAADGVFWNDANGDGIPQRDECVISPAKGKTEVGQAILPNIPLALDGGWGTRIGPDFSIYATEGWRGPKDTTGRIARYRPLRFTPRGAPVYGPEGMEVLGEKFIGDLLPSPDGKQLACVGNFYNFNLLYSIRMTDKRVEWSYPNRFAGPQGSWKAPMPTPGLIIGTLKVCGVADPDGEAPPVMLIRGNMGQNYLMTLDGLFVATMMKDIRSCMESLPADENRLAELPMEMFSEQGEPFNGWFGRQDDGKIRQTSGMGLTSAMIMEIKGLESIKPFDAGALRLDEPALKEALAANEARKKAAARAQTAAAPLSLIRLPAPPPLRGEGQGWEQSPGVTVRKQGRPDQARVKLGYDDDNLYLLFDMTDPTPWQNAGQDASRLFKTGDAVDLHLATDPRATPGRREPAAGDLRILIAPRGGKPCAVLMQPVAPQSPAELRRVYESPVMTKAFDRVEELKDARIEVKIRPDGYRVEAAIPLADLGWKPRPGTTVRGDVGFISSDVQGQKNAARTYWSNPDTGLVSDLPSEAWLYPLTWGEIKIGEAAPGGPADPAKDVLKRKE